ncbi:MAG: tetratricopeptide repeat protein [Candidatus Polarisedimenticolaceae bacterium]|nr:tetratricopeptide repeat protein [Candidatus Polarisedimenticolaceae bacterium]
MLRILLVVLIAFIATPATSGEQEALNEAKTLLEQGYPDRAIKQLDGFLASNPEHAEARFLKGLILVNQDQLEAAIKIFEALTKDYPELPEPYNNLAVSYSALGRFDDARKALQSAITTHPSYATAHENLGNIYAMMAADAYNHALSLDKENAAARDKLALMSELFSVGTINNASHQSATAASTPATEAQPAPAAQAAAPAIEEEDSELAMLMEDDSDGTEGLSELEQGILSTAHQWAQTWSSKDVAGYLSHYHATFKPSRGLSRAAWEQQRKQRIAKPRFIEIEVLDPEITVISEDEARVEFLQTYRSNTYSDESRKYLRMKRDGNDWKIVREVSLQ